MQPGEHGDVVAERGAVVARVLEGDTGVDDAIALLDRAEAAAQVPLVDESERARLADLAAGRVQRVSHWHSLLARRRDEAVGYAGVLLPADPGGPATGDLAIRRDRAATDEVMGALFAGMEGLAWGHRAGRLRVWLRHSSVDDVASVAHEGYAIERRLAVMGRDLAGFPSPRPTPDGISIRPYRPDEDDRAVIGILSDAYAGTAEGGWDLSRFAERRGYAWFDPDDLLIAEDREGREVGLHWTKRRSATVGEVYNLAVGSDAQGTGLGRVLLDAGLDHLARQGCDEVLLWVDLSNERAVRLYSGRGFLTRWEDLALTRTLRG